MRFQKEIIISSSVVEVADLFGNQNNNDQWQVTLMGSEVDSFDDNKSLNYYQINGRILEVHIHIVENNLPTCMKTVAYMKSLTQNVKHEFYECSQNRTIWVTDTEFLTESWFLKLLMLFMPSQFKKRTINYMNDFKTFAEKTKIVTDELKEV